MRTHNSCNKMPIVVKYDDNFYFSVWQWYNNLDLATGISHGYEGQILHMTAVFPTNTGARQFYIVKKSIFPRSTRGFPFYISLLKLYMRALCCTSVLKNTISSTYVIFSTAVGTLGHDPPPLPHYYTMSTVWLLV